MTHGRLDVCICMVNCFPLQVMGFHKARVPFGRTRVYSGMIHCFIIVWKEEGMLGFYKGASVALIKVSTYSTSVLISNFRNILSTLVISLT